MELRIGDCREVLADVPDNSVPLILTDPPYGDEAEPLYEWLAEFAARTLIPGGSLICYTGQARLDRDMRILSSQLRYWWLLAMMHHQSQRLPGKFVIVGFKPVLWYVKDHRRGRSLVPDVLKPPARDKELHNWSQGDGGVSQLIEHLTEPGELIVDPFAGTAAWGHRAHDMGRRWLGSDVIEGGVEVVAAE
jgi:DNA modification methylase